jgi:hypothetical protein
MQPRIPLARTLAFVLLWKLPVAAVPAAAQGPVVPTAPCPAWEHLVVPGSPTDERIRLAQLLDASSPQGTLLRSPSTATAAPSSSGTLCVQGLAPELRSVWNSALPFSQNEGALWAGRGRNVLLLAGGRAHLGPVSVTLAPEAVYAANTAFTILPDGDYHRLPGRNRFASIWHTRPTQPSDPAAATIDMPYRFGDEPVHGVGWGQSSLSVSVGPLQAGAAHENQWWGPGIRNALVLSSNAPGFGHLFVRPGRPLRSFLGEIDGRWLVGELRESAYFDSVSTNDLRSLSGIAFTFTPAWERHLTLGVARTVISPVRRRSEIGKHSLRALLSWERRDSAGHLAWEPRSDQLLSVFGRWVLPADGVEVYAEWARHELPVSLRDLLLAPHHTQGYTLGGQWARPVRSGALRLQGEATYLEQSATLFQRPSSTFYTGRASPHGYTHRGQVLGAAIGPGSSSQWVALDYLRPDIALGVLGGRIRWENDAMYTSHPRGFFRSAHAHDVSVLGGVRGGVTRLGFHVHAEWISSLRYNYLFQNPDRGFGPDGAVDVWNHTLRVNFGPARAGR